VTSPTASVKVPATSGVTPSSGQKSKTHPPKPYDLVQRMEHVIDMMEELQTSSALHTGRVAPQDLPVRPAASQRCIQALGGKVDPDPIWATTTN
jgi:hypothetical protein